MWYGICYKKCRQLVCCSPTLNGRSIRHTPSDMPVSGDGSDRQSVKD